MSSLQSEAPLAGQVDSEIAHPTQPDTIAGFRTYVLLACIAAASLGLEIQTRILSLLYYNHVVYITVTIALLGFGISGVLVSLFASRCLHPERAISLLAAAFVFSSFICMALVSRIPGRFPLASPTFKLVLSYLALTMPFLFSGAVAPWRGLVCLALQRCCPPWFSGVQSLGSRSEMAIVRRGPMSGLLCASEPQSHWPKARAL